MSSSSMSTRLGYALLAAAVALLAACPATSPRSAASDKSGSPAAAAPSTQPPSLRAAIDAWRNDASDETIKGVYAAIPNRRLIYIVEHIPDGIRVEGKMGFVDQPQEGVDVNMLFVKDDKGARSLAVFTDEAAVEKFRPDAPRISEPSIAFLRRWEQGEGSEGAVINPAGHSFPLSKAMIRDLLAQSK